MRLRRFAAICALVAVSACASGGDSAASRAGGFAPSIAHGAPHVIFDDEFNGNSLNTKIWYPCYNWGYAKSGCSIKGELEWYEPANVTVFGGMLQLTAKYQMVTRGKKTYHFTSGMIQAGGTPYNGSKPSFSYLYGYAEVRAKMPSGSIGMWPAFWFLPADNSWPPEIDVMEWQGTTPNFDYVTLWWSLPNGDATRSFQTGQNLSSAFHTYGFDWQAGYADFYFDRKLVMHYTGPNVPHKAVFPILNLAIGGWAKGQFNPPPSEFPATYYVDYIRIWNQRPF